MSDCPIFSDEDGSKVLGPTGQGASELLLSLLCSPQPAQTLPEPGISVFHPKQKLPFPPLNGYELSEINSYGSEYAKVSGYVRATMKHVKIEKIRKLKNLQLLDTFQRKKMEMKVTEKYLFCATHRAHVDSICANNFDWILHGTSEGTYGKGNYFTKDAITAHKNFQSDPQNIVMFFARVLVGDVIEGKRSYTSPPPPYDSCVDSRLNPSIFVIFQKNQIYPEYVIEYTEADKACVVS
ncbi:zinc finger CCCH-type antiviral protein 1-like [Myotis myotis]|uniref:zinc finger CCCH-type antiviral protein 1-like n=1 Tax=Myotis myotis TaxID=51298 RepID=UPI00174EC5D0|nr:zinc finger CCCH-type antiviral protein 1-like [Myotis myotis]